MWIPNMIPPIGSDILRTDDTSACERSIEPFSKKLTRQESVRFTIKATVVALRASVMVMSVCPKALGVATPSDA